jgi:hypothetical protein
MYIYDYANQRPGHPTLRRNPDSLAVVNESRNPGDRPTFVAYREYAFNVAMRSTAPPTPDGGGAAVDDLPQVARFDAYQPPLQPPDIEAAFRRPHYVFLAHKVTTAEERLREMSRWSRAVEPGVGGTVQPTVRDLRTELHLLVPGLQFGTRDILDVIPHRSLFTLVELIVLQLVGDIDRRSAALRARDEVRVIVESREHAARIIARLMQKSYIKKVRKRLSLGDIMEERVRKRLSLGDIMEESIQRGIPKLKKASRGGK